MIKVLARKITAQATFAVRKLGSCFMIKGETELEQKHNVIYHGKCPEGDFGIDYISEMKRRIVDRIKDHRGKDTPSYTLKNAIVSENRNIIVRNFTIIFNGCRKSTMKRKIAEFSIIKQRKPT